MLRQSIFFFINIVVLVGLNCNTSTNSCSQSPECIDYQFDLLSLTCINCASLTSSKCVYTNNQICTTYVYLDGKCIDCSLAENNKCKYSNVAACQKYGYDGSSKCYNCEEAVQSQCIYQRVKDCSDYAYDKDTYKCFKCQSNATLVWTDSMCLACNASTDNTIANQAKTGCENPSDRTKAFSSFIQPILIQLIIFSIIT